MGYQSVSVTHEVCWGEEVSWPKTPVIPFKGPLYFFTTTTPAPTPFLTDS